MDSLSQIVLGASMGELVLGKKIGNRAMFWGAIGGTLPDLDVISSLWLSEIDGLASHRGITHSLFILPIAALPMAYLTKKWYDSDIPNHKNFRWISGIWAIIAVLGFSAMSAVLGNALFGPKSLWITGPLVLFGLYHYVSRIYKNYIISGPTEIRASFKDWYLLAFLSLVTHPILDCFTTYGTQIFQPFSDYRVGFNNIAVADPLWTLPFLSFLIAAAYFKPGDERRGFYNKLGIIVSSLYMLWTLANKHIVEQIVKQNIQEKKLIVERFTTSPTILNNILWTATLESDTVFYQGSYGLLDRSKDIQFDVIPKKHYLLQGHEEDYSIQILKWFSNDYFSMLIRQDGKLQYNDLRFGSFSDGPKTEDDYVFRFPLILQNNELVLGETQRGPSKEKQNTMASDLWKRILGNK